MAALVCFGKAQSRESSMDYIAKENDVNLTTICPGLITGREFCSRNPKATIAYLKGAQEMYRSGVLATVDVMRLAEVHVSVYEAAMNESAFGRYICFDQVIETEQQAEKIAEEANMSKNKICGNDEGSTSSVHHSHLRFELSNLKLTR